MGKFKLDKITGVGEGLLNEQSKNVAVQKRTEYIPISKTIQTQETDYH